METGAFIDLNTFPYAKVSLLPPPFNSPDVVIFEDFYIPRFLKLALELRKLQVPYIIIPRGSLTKLAQKKKWFKKKVFNFLVFKNFARNAAGIQYLTQHERDTSGESWNSSNIIIPNGVSMKDIGEERNKPTNVLSGVFIGRFDPFHKGLDFLISAVHTLQEILRQEKLIINVHGPERLGYKEKFKNEIKEKQIDDILLLHDGVFGKEKEQVLLNNTFFVLTSRFEGHPMGLIEALSYGLPCLITKGTNMGEEVEKYNAGWVAENSSESVTDALRRLIAEKHTLLEKSRNAIVLASKYDWDFLAQTSHEEYLRLIFNTTFGY